MAGMEMEFCHSEDSTDTFTASNYELRRTTRWPGDRVAFVHWTCVHEAQRDAARAGCREGQQVIGHHRRRGQRDDEAGGDLWHPRGEVGVSGADRHDAAGE
eukprot:2762967-Rhodomonas_salina.1